MPTEEGAPWITEKDEGGVLSLRCLACGEAFTMPHRDAQVHRTRDLMRDGFCKRHQACGALWGRNEGGAHATA